MVPRWPPAAFRGVVLFLCPWALISSCLNDYDQFEAAGSKVDPQVGGATDLGGAAGAPALAGGIGGLGGAAGSDEPFGAGSSGEGGLGGAGGSGDGGSAGAPPLVCDAPTVACGAVCADTISDEEHCGSCGNSCTAQSLGFECTSGSCGCTALEQCGNDGAERGCVDGRCLCNGVSCAPGEICGRRGNQIVCRCNGSDACPAGMTCCESPRGCFDLQTDAANCGVCGHACAVGESCNLGQCG